MLKIVLMALALIASVIATVLGTITVFGFQMILAGSLLMVLGLISLPVSIYFLSKANKDFQRLKLENVLANPDKILLKFPSKEGEVILTDDAIFQGTQHFPFAAFYESIVDIKLEGNKLYVESEINGGDNRIPRFKEFEIPSELLVHAENAAAKIRSKYLSK